ncbi:MAG TPA: galactokinase family protein, partial [Solirubrobacteraceae bacterium]|nr:galactokinase family protein [Solirubrobacteraceae bacterium]
MIVAFSPGRVNLVGEHTDYNDGLALPFAIARGVTVRAEPAPGDAVEVIASDLRERDRFDPSDLRAGAVGGWRAFARGVAAELAATGVRPRGARLEVSGDLPHGAGLASSAALTVALALALLAVADEPEGDRVALARLCSRVEGEWVGARTGLLDQLACLLAGEGAALLVDFRTLEHRAVPLRLEGWRLVCVDSGEAHDHATSGYNERRAECERAARLLGVASLRDAPDEPDALGALP